MAQGDDPAADLKVLASRATGDDADAAKTAVAQLRAIGPAGLKALLDQNAEIVARHLKVPSRADAPDAAEWARVTAAIDRVAAQKDAYSSGLYWYTDLEVAKAAARASGKPILSLRLLGTLDSEYSCANSRFFRTVLYANGDVARALSEKFVLHWKSVRPVPKITIDFGDGRVVERTITGNSIHYVLDADGNVIDGIPGLYGPKAFLRQISDAEAMSRQLQNISPGQRTAALRDWHLAGARRDLAEWESDLRKVGAAPALSASIGPNYMVVDPNNAAMTNTGVGPNPATALAAGRRALGKSAVEMPMVRALAQPGGAEPPALGGAAAFEAVSTNAVWAQIAALHADDARLDRGSKALMAAKNPNALSAGRLAASKSAVETPMVRLVRNFEHSIAEDTVRNEYTFHRQIHQWLAQGATPDGKPIPGVDALNDQVYAQLFLTPSTDPWLGLVPADTYTALPDEGVCKK